VEAQYGDFIIDDDHDNFAGRFGRADASLAAVAV
jgi:hypothetical protein